MMNDRILTSVANRRIFRSSVFRVDRWYRPYTPDRDEAELRRILRTDDTLTDYYLAALLAAVEAFPDIKARFGETRQTWDIAEYQPLPSLILGAKPVSGVRAGKFLSKASGWPAVTSWTAALEGNSVAVTVRGIRRTVPAEIASGKKIWPVWPAEVPFSGGFEISQGTWEEIDELWEMWYQPWGTETRSPDSIRFFHEPPEPDYADLARRLQASAAVHRVLARHGLAGRFAGTSDPVEKAAAAALAAGLSNTAVYPVQQFVPDTVSVMLPPAPPAWPAKVQGLEAENPDAQQATAELSWEPAPGAVSYEIERNGQTAVSGVHGTAWTDTSPVSGAENIYRVRGVNKHGTGEWSDPAVAAVWPDGRLLHLDASF